jgi:hypothetical protein
MAGRTEFYCPSNETSLGSQFKWLEYTFKTEGLNDIWSNADGQRARRADKNRITRRPTNNSGRGQRF